MVLMSSAMAAISAAMADWTHLSLTADARKTLESELAASQGDYRKTMQAIDDYVDDLVSDLFDPDDTEHSLAYTDPDAIADAARDIVSLAQEAADSRYAVQRAAWQEAAGTDFPSFAGADREDWTRVMWDVQKGFSNTDYNGLTYGQVMAGRARSGVTIMDLLPKAVSNNPDDMQQAYADFLRQMASHAAQRQQMANIAADPTRPRWARVPRGRVTCAFCTMLAGRGFVYTSEDAAGGGLGNVYHAHCDCEPVPSWGEANLSGYDPERLDALYKEAARGLPSGASYRDVLARMRAQGGVADSPATQAGGGGGKPPKPPKATAAAANDGPERWADENAVFVRNREGETVCISNRVIGHVIDGDAKGGGHSAHATKPGKSHFPASWSDDKIKGEIEKTVAYPDEIREIAPGKRILTRGVDGTSVTVVVVKTKKGWKVRTAYPEVDDKRGLDT